VLLAHPGTQYAAKLAHQLWRGGILRRFWTGLAVTQDGIGKLQRYLPVLHRRLHNRAVDIPSSCLRTLPALEVSYLIKRSFRGESQRILQVRNSSFQQRIPGEEIRASDIGVGFDTSSNILIDRFHALGKPFILDQTIAHSVAKAQVFDRVREQFPAWGDDLDHRPDEVAVAESQEQEKADRIVVASSFTKSTLLKQGVTPDKIVVNPYGVDLRRFHAGARNSHEPFQFLFAGLISARKGIPLLLEAWRQLRPTNAELLLAGPMSNGIPKDWLNPTQNVRFVGKLPNAELARVMARSDVFVFPSYFEGFGLVLLEAMASGMPVITTTATAGRDIVEEEESGWVIEPGDLNALVQRMQFCLDNRKSLLEIGNRGRAIAEDFSWNAYGERWAKLLKEQLTEC
jgi:glycosyltransferase involved in cell wall biosynthesis